MEDSDKMDTSALHAEVEEEASLSPQTNNEVEATVPMDCEEDVHEDTSSASPAPSNPSPTPSNPSPTSLEKKLELKTRFLNFHKQVTAGCGRFECPNKECASNEDKQPLSGKKAASESFRLLKSKATLCDVVEPLNISRIREMITTAEQTNDTSAAVRYLFDCFSKGDVLDVSFVSKCAQDEGKYRNATEQNPEIDMKAVDEVYRLILDNDNLSEDATDRLTASLGNAIKKLLVQQINRPFKPQHLRKWVILLMCPLFYDFTHYGLLKNLCGTIQKLREEARKVYVQWFSGFNHERIENLLSVLQQYITIKWMDSDRQYEDVGPIVLVMDIIHEANKTTKYLEYSAFYNDAINEKYKYAVREDYIHWRRKHFSFAEYSFLLDAASKTQLLQLDASSQMSHEFHSAVFNVLFSGNRAHSPYLILNIRRDQLIHDALTQLQSKDGMDLKKPLKVKFAGEEGVDEGGVQKEFFQLVIRQLFQPNYGMFEYLEDTRLYWFNKDAYETPLEFELIGIILGLAVYNGVILDVHFPDIVYKKLMNKNHKVTLRDLQEFKPEVAANLNKLLNFDGDVSSLALTFTYQYMLYGQAKTVELKENGTNIPLTNENREEYVELYVDYLVNTSVTKQFGAFYEGFHLVCGGEVFGKFTWQELVLLICGSDELNFHLLEEAARYEDGFQEDSTTVVDFWSVIHDFDEEDKKKFLFFCTGSDRVPIRGLGDLILTISKNGVDNKRLPTAHTCFNHLLLPDYETKLILKERLTKAIQNAEGFGLL